MTVELTLWFTSLMLEWCEGLSAAPWPPLCSLYRFETACELTNLSIHLYLLNAPLTDRVCIKYGLCKSYIPIANHDTNTWVGFVFNNLYVGMMYGIVGCSHGLPGVFWIDLQRNVHWQIWPYLYMVLTSNWLIGFANNVTYADHRFI